MVSVPNIIIIDKTEKKSKIIFHPYQNHVAIKITKLCIWNMLVILCYQLLSTAKASIKTKYDLATWLLKQSKAALIHIFFILFFGKLPSRKKYHVYKYILLSYLLSNHKKQAIICWIIVIIKKRIRTYRWKRKNKSSFIFISLFSDFKAVKGCIKARQRKCTDYYLFCQHSAC